MFKPFSEDAPAVPLGKRRQIGYIQACECLDREEAHVIKRAYMDGAKWLQIAHEITCSESTVYRLRKQAIRKLADNIDVKRRQ